MPRPPRAVKAVLQLEAELAKIPDTQMELRVRLLEKIADLRIAQYEALKRNARKRKEKNENMVRPNNAMIAKKIADKKNKARAPEEPEPVTDWSSLV